MCSGSDTVDISVHGDDVLTDSDVRGPGKRKLIRRSESAASVLQHVRKVEVLELVLNGFTPVIPSELGKGKLVRQSESQAGVLEHVREAEVL